jgi:primary-amine oxidase
LTSHCSTAVPTPGTQEPAHPLDPLSGGEIAAAVAALREAKALDDRVRFVMVALDEPDKAAIRAFEDGGELDRHAQVVLVSPSEGASYEGVVRLADGEVVDWQRIAEGQPPFTGEEQAAAEELIKQDPRFRSALAERGITEVDAVSVDSFPVSAMPELASSGTRLTAMIAFLRSSPGGNGYARPIEGIVGVVDLEAMAVIDVTDSGVVPVPPEPGAYRHYEVTPRSGLKPLEISQPEGPSFEVEGREVSWQKWRFRVGVTPREGLVLHTIGYEDEGRLRPIVHRASYSEMAVPYGDPSPTRYFIGSFEIGETSMLGARANPLTLGCDCLGLIYYFDAVVTGDNGEPVVIPRAICMHEEDHGTLWKHTHERTGEVEVRRARRLAISWYTSIGNYDYGFYWYLYQDGTIESEVRLTGIMLTGALAPGEQPANGTLVAPQLQAPVHQHLFNARLDMAVDGDRNSVYMMESVEPPADQNPHGNAFAVRSELQTREDAVEGRLSPQTGRSWVVVNESSHNRLGQAVGYRLLPGETVAPFAQKTHDRLVGFARKSVWVTPFDARERYAGGDYPNQNARVDGLARWTEAGRDIADTDLVLWYSFGSHHIPRPEDWPVMPAHHIGFKLKPFGFFTQNPGLDVPPPG